ncbi:MAG: hypothetical protein UW92_C0007G0009 [Candidatus Jorgensenbacteria bacterium GW2011_GWA2_45_13]|uniref:TrbC/VIRB2 family protein n=1 Tax=Candidatus Jorgensenbacteria bacterium GW2011_GWA2_45_13 TaxID=1618662 RepID=A0A0G1L8F5_9BACT|nr:MAG: hypothetical protein UW92_C0007G0009 [Candidatus Jorgensenbacteria bacterium GW2011_GWA2_45_13]
MKKKVLPFFILFVALTALSAPLCFANATPITLENPLGTTNSVTELLKNIIQWMITIGAPIAVGIIIYGSIEMLFSGGNPEKFTKGKNTILYAVIGYGIITIGWGIVSIIEKLLQ